MISKLRVEGRWIKDDAGRTVLLRGVVKHGFEDDPRAHWITKDGVIQWMTFDPVVVADNLDAMKSWGCNVLRIYGTVEFWINDTENQRQIIKDLATMCNERGLYLIVSWWHILQTAPQTNMPYPPYSNLGDEALIGSESDFVDFWVSVATELKDHPNVIFELWNEASAPEGSSPGTPEWEGAKNSWFDTVQSCISAIRGVTDNIILVQWLMGVWCALDYTANARTMEWIDDPRLEGVNIVYSTHIYRDAAFWLFPERHYAYTYDEFKEAMQVCKVDWVATQNKCLLIGETGTLEDDAEQIERWRNELQIFNEWQLGYLGFWWWPMGVHRLQKYPIEPNFPPSEAGQILIDKIAEAAPTPIPPVAVVAILAIPIVALILWSALKK